MKTEILFGLRREAQRHAALNETSRPRKAVSPPRSATAVQNFVALLLCVLALIPSALEATTNDLTALLQQGLFEEQASRNLDAAIEDYTTLARQFDKDRQLAATAIFRLGECYRAQGKTSEAAAQYQRILRDFSDQQTLATLSRQNLAGMVGEPSRAAVSSSVEPASTTSQATSELEKELALLKARVELANHETNRAVLVEFIGDKILQEDLELCERVRSRLESAKSGGKSEWSVSQLEESLKSCEDRFKAHFDHWCASQEYHRRYLESAISHLPKTASNARQQQNDLLAKQIALAEQDLADTKKMFQVGKATQAEVRAAEREGLRLRQQLAALDANKAELLDVSIPATSEEDQEIARIQAMIQNSPDLVNAPNGQSGTLLCVAAQKGQLRVAQFLLEHGADVQRGFPLAQAAGNGHKAMVELLLQHGAAVNAAEGDSQTALHRAAAHGYLSVTETLLAAKADVNAQAENGRTPLTLAVENSVVPVAATLLTHGADPNIVCRARQNYATDRKTTGSPLHFAVARGDEAMVALLLTNRADLTLRSPLGESALDIAAILGKPRIVRQLIAAGADVNAASSAQDDKTPLHHATLGEFREIVALLLEHGANPNVTAHLSRNGATPLMTAAAQGNSEIASLLLKHKADPNLTDQNGDVALLFAIRKQSPATVRALLAGGANPDAQTANGYPVLVLAAATDAANKEVMAALIEAKANVNAPDPEGKTPLHWAAERNRKDLVELLGKAGADVNLRTKSGATPLDYAKSSDSSAGRRPGMGLPRPGSGLPQPLSYQWNNSAGQTAPTTNATTTADLLRQNGALDELPDFTRIRITRQGLSQPVQVCFRASTLTNQFTLLETVMRFYSFSPVYISGVGNQEAWRALPFPDFGRIIIRRPNQKIGGKEQEIKVSLLNSSNVVDCARDVPVQFGDVIEIPESVHALNAKTPNPVGEMEATLKLCAGLSLNFAERTELTQESVLKLRGNPSSILCLQKSVQLVVAGETTTFKLDSWKEGFLGSALQKTEARSALRSSSDLSRVQVTRKTGQSAKPVVITVDVSDPSQRNDDLWLQDSDVIEVPEKR